MKAGALLSELSQRNIRLERRGDRLHIEAPKGALTAELTESLRMHKAELLVILAGLCHDCHERPVAEGSGYFCEGCIAKMAPADTTAYPCPSCGRPARLLGRYLAADGEGQYHCGQDGCLVIWRRPASGDDGEV